MQETIKLKITVAFYAEKALTVDLPIDAIESGNICNGKICDIDQIDYGYLERLYKDNGIHPDSVGDVSWEECR